MRLQSTNERTCCEVSIGVDLVSVGRFGRLIREHPGAISELFTAAELAGCAGKRRRLEHLAVRFAAKEAVLKALGTGLAAHMQWTDIEVTNSAAGRPLVRLRGAVAAHAHMCGFPEVTVSLTHSAGLAIAQAAAVRRGHDGDGHDSAGHEGDGIHALSFD